MCFIVPLLLAMLAEADEECLEMDVRMLQHSAFVSIETQLASESEAARKSLENCGHLIQDACDPNANASCSNNCRIHTHGHDCYRPVPEVMAEHPGEDGFCYFNYTGFWVDPLGDNPDYVQSASHAILAIRGSYYEGFKKGPLITFNFEGKAITTYMDAMHYSYDDLYGYSLGYLQGQGLEPSLLQNNTEWISVSKAKCDQIQNTYKFQNEELVLADWLDYNQVIATKVACSAKLQPYLMSKSVLAAARYKSIDDCDPVTARDFAKHHYIKCLLGYPNSAADAAYLLARACLLEMGTHIGHFSECPYSPDVDF